MGIQMPESDATVLYLHLTPDNLQIFSASPAMQMYFSVV